MITPQAPTPQPTNYLTTSTTQAVGSQQGHNDPQQIIKEVYLRHLIDGSIKQNEAKGVVTGVSIIDLSSHRTLVSYQQDKEHFAASINKLPVSLLLLEDLRSNKVSLDTPLTWTEADRRGGFGDFDQAGSPLSAPLRDVLNDMLNKSGNTAVRIIVNNVLGGATAVNERWATKPGLSHTYLQPLDATRFYLGYSTPHDSLWVINELMKHQDQYASFMKNAMATNIFEDFGVRSQLADGSYMLLVNKIGLLDDVDGNNRHDVGILYNQKTRKSYAYSIMTTTPYNETDPSATERADQSLKDMGKSLLGYAGGKKTHNHAAGGEWRRHVEHRIKY